MSHDLPKLDLGQVLNKHAHCCLRAAGQTMKDELVTGIGLNLKFDLPCGLYFADGHTESMSDIYGWLKSENACSEPKMMTTTV